ncbi:MAG: hypothetical protein Q4E24_03355 [bacterium]|nr:hypothetical protein [bacterium]
MIHAVIKIQEIDYEKSFINLFPRAMEKLNQKEHKNLAVRFLQKMGDSSVPVALGTLDRMTERGKGELLIKIVNVYQQEFLVMLNRFLEKKNLGNQIQIGSFRMGWNKKGKMVIVVRDVKADCAEILQSDSVQQKIWDFAGAKAPKIGGSSVFQLLAANSVSAAAKFAANRMPDEMEKMAISVMEKPENKKRILNLAEQAMEKNGLCVKLEDISFRQADASGENVRAAEKTAQCAAAGESTEVSENAPTGEGGKRERGLEGLELSSELEEEILNAAAEYFKEIVR